MRKWAAAAAVAGAFVSPVDVATSARAGEVECCTYIVSETEADGVVTASRVTFRSGQRAADAVVVVTAERVVIRDRRAPIQAPGCDARSRKEVVCRDAEAGDVASLGRWVRMFGGDHRDRLVVGPFRQVRKTFVELRGNAGDDTLIGGLGVGRDGRVGLSGGAGRDRLLLSSAGPRFDDRLQLGVDALTLVIGGASRHAGLRLRVWVEAVNDGPTRTLARGTATVARNPRPARLGLTGAGRSYVRGSASPSAGSAADVRLQIRGRGVAAQAWLEPSENGWMFDPLRGASVLEDPGTDAVGSIALAPDGTVAVGNGCCGTAGSVLVRTPESRRWRRAGIAAVDASPVVAAGPRGRLLAVAWRQRGSAHTLIRRERDGSGRWSPPAIIATARARPGAPAVAVDAAGRVIVSWRVRGRQYAAFRDSGGRWQRVVLLGAAARDPSYRVHGDDRAEVALSPYGTAWVAWQGGRGRLLVTSQAAGRTGFARPRALGARGGHLPTIAAGPSGEAVIAWLGSPPDEEDITLEEETAPVYAAFVSRAGRVRPPTRLSTAPTGTSEVFVTLTPAGVATVVWQPTLGNHARYATSRANGSFGPARMLTGVSIEPSFAGLPPLALHADGRVLLLGNGPSGARIYARRGEGGFRPAFRPPPSDVYPGDGAGLAVAGDRILAVWQKPASPTADAESGEPHLVLDPGPL